MTSHITYDQRYRTVGAHVLDALPTAARKKWNAIKTADQEAHAIAQSAREQIRSHTAQRRILASELHKLSILAENDDKARAKAGLKENELKALDAEIERAEEYASEVNERADQKRAVCRAIEAWFSHQHDRKFTTEAGSTNLRKGEAPADAVTRVRREIAKLEKERERVRNAPVPAEDRKARVRALVTSKEVPPHVSGQTGGAVEIDLMPPAGLGMKGPISSAGVEGLLTWLFGEQIIAKLEAQIDAETDADAAISAPDKAGMDKELAGKILKLERDEESLIEQSESEGREIPRRPDAAVEAILGISTSLSNQS